MHTTVNEQLAQQIVNAVKNVCGQNINFISPKGIIMASTDPKRIGNYHEIGKEAAAAGKIIEVTQESYAGTQPGVNLPIYHNEDILAVIGITGPPDEVRKYAYLAERITLLLIREKELGIFSRTQKEKRHYILNALIHQENVNPDYLQGALEEWNISQEEPVRLVVIHLESDTHLAEMSLMEQKIFQQFKSMDALLYTHNYPNEYLGVIKGALWARQQNSLEQFGKAYPQYMQIGVGKESSLRQLWKSYDSALTALGSLAHTHLPFALYDTLTLEIILSSIDESKKDSYMQKVAAKLSPEDMHLLSTYYQQDMSLVSTSKKLFLHKNTVQNKLDRIYDTCGYNPRKFKDAVILYLAVRLKNQK